MAEVKIKEVKTESDLLDFIKFPMELYKKCKNYVPPLIQEEKQTFDSLQNPALQFSEKKLYLALNGEKVVGRIAVIHNRNETERKIRFGWIDFIDDINVSEALLNKAKDFATEKHISKIEGPMGFTNLDKAGMLTFGFNRLATMVGIYNFEYYPEHMEKLGFHKEKEWVEYEIEFPKELPDKIIKFNNLILKKYKLRLLKFKSKREILNYVEPMFKLLDQTHRSLSTYTPITDEQIKNYREKYFGFIQKDYLICIEDENNQLIAFAITMPSYSKALQKAKGKLFPFGWFHLLQAGYKNDRANFYLIGIHPEYQKRGITSIIFKEMYEVFKRKGIRYLETNPELEENKAIQVLWQDYHPKNHKRRRTYSFSI